MGRISVGDTLSNSWRAFVNNLGALIVAGILVPVITVVTLGILGPPMMLGLTMMALRSVRGEKVEIGDVFQGLSRFVSAWGATLIIMAVFLILYAILLPIVRATKAGRGSEQAKGFMAGISAVGMVAIVVIMVVLAVPFALTYPAIADGMGAIEAVSYSVRAGLANIGSLLILGAIASVVTTALQSITFGLGSVLASPWSMCVFAEAYNEVAGATQPSGGIVEAEPNPPTDDEAPPPEQQV